VEATQRDDSSGIPRENRGRGILTFAYKIPECQTSPSDFSTMGGLSHVYFAQTWFDRMIAHVIAGLPNEACGLFAGTGEQVETLYALTNADPTPQSYLVEPREHFQAFKDSREKGQELLGCFHSHVRSQAYPSMTDVRQAAYPDWAYVIVSLQEEVSVVRAFRIVDEQIREISILVKDISVEDTGSHVR